MPAFRTFDFPKRTFSTFVICFLSIISIQNKGWAGKTGVHQKIATLEKLEASVNSSLILKSDVQKFREVTKLRAQLDPLFAGTPIAAKGEKVTDSEIIDFLIDEKIISQQFPTTDTEVEQEINSIQSNNRLDRAGLKEALAREGFKFLDYFELIRSSASKRALYEREIRPKVVVSDDDVKNYFYNHYSGGTNSPRAFHIEMISVSTQSYKTTAAANSAIVQALKDIKNGESFEEVAKRVSDDGSAASGGDLGILTDDQMAPVIRNQVKKLRIGQVSEVFGGGNFGRFFILKLLDVKSNETEHLTKMSEEIRTKLAAAEYQHQVSLWLERKRQSAFIHRAGEPSIKPASLLQPKP